ncbi:O-antigen ligase family protein [Candidatus Gottesmanbacteria bacterium]|nr:O-antigen ligase family protein [Candidatus Gottesmanbacteria bacterium]
MSRFIFYLLILFLPSQLGKHFWPDFALVQGLKIDYLSPTIYFTDILVFGLFMAYLPKTLGYLSRLRYLRNLWIIIPAAIFLFLSSLFAISPALFFLKLLKIMELIFLGFYVSRERGKSLSLKKIILLLSLSVFYEAILGFCQFFRQASVGGLWWFLGERTFSAATPGIAQAIINGELLLRPYATFPHPNVLGGYMAIVLPLILFVLINKSTKKKPLNTYFLLLTTILGIISLFLSFSRTAWIVGTASMTTLIFFLTKNKIKTLGILLAVFLVGFMTVGRIIASRLQTLETVDKQSLIFRQQLNEASVKMILDHPAFGVGLNNFLIALPHYYQLKDITRFYQPAHNIYLMIAAEAGLLGLVLFLFFILFTLRHLILNTLIPKFLNSLIFILLCEILFLGLFDHYFYTLQQGQLLIALVFGIAWSKKARL